MNPQHSYLERWRLANLNCVFLSFRALPPAGSKYPGSFAIVGSLESLTLGLLALLSVSNWTVWERTSPQFTCLQMLMPAQTLHLLRSVCGPSQAHWVKMLPLDVCVPPEAGRGCSPPPAGITGSREPPMLALGPDSGPLEEQRAPWYPCGAHSLAADLYFTL